MAGPETGGDSGFIRRRCEVFIPGDGFSATAGLPVAAELWKEVRARAERMSGRVEKFMGFLDIEFYPNIRGSQTWCDGGNETRVLVALPGCVSQGDTREGVIRNIREAADRYIEDCIASGDPVPTEAGREYFELVTTGPQ